MTKEQYNAEANQIRLDHPLTFPPENIAYALYAHAFWTLNQRREAERMAEYQQKLADYQKTLERESK